MNILLINHYAGSPRYGMEFRPYYLSREWNKQGHNTLIVAANFSHLRRQQPEKLGFESIDGITYCWIKTLKYKSNGVRRFLSMLQFVTKLWFNNKKYLNDFKPDVVIASSTYPLDIYPAKKIAKHYGAKLIYEVHDLWPLSPMELGGYSKWHPFILIMQTAEDYCYKHCDAVVSLLPKAEDYMSTRGLAKGKFFYVPNGVVLDDWEKPEAIPNEYQSLIKSLKSSGTFLVAYAGSHGIANSLYSIIDAVGWLSKENIHLFLLGTGNEKENLIKYVKSKNYINITFLNPINKLAVPTFLKEMDLLYIGLQKQSLFRFGISPNKIFDYMMASKPIIQAIDAGNNLVKEANCGIYVEPDNIDEIKEGILNIANMSEEERSNLGKNGYNFVMENHTYNVLGRNFINVLEKILSE